VAGDENGRDLGVELMDAPEDFEAGEVGQMEIQNHHVGLVLGDHCQPFRRRGGRQQRDVQFLKALPEGMEDGRLIINHQ
jgi:hypothetical protein